MGNILTFTLRIHSLNSVKHDGFMDLDVQESVNDGEMEG